MEAYDATGFTLRKRGLYRAPLISTLTLRNQGIPTFKNGYVINLDFWKPHLEVLTLLIFWMAITTSLMMMKRVQRKVTLMRRNTKDYHSHMR